eukprot:4999498-Pleurochrysis_carterae.AAC.13
MANARRRLTGGRSQWELTRNAWSVRKDGIRFCLQLGVPSVRKRDGMDARFRSASFTASSAGASP